LDLPVPLFWTPERLEEHGLVAPAHRETIPDAPQNLTELYDSTLAADPERIALVGRSGALSFAALEAQVNAACAYLAGLGVQAGDRVAASLANDIHIVVAFLAVQRLGAIWVGINRAYVSSERRRLLTDAGVSVLIADPSVAADTAPTAQTVPDLRHIVVLDAADTESSMWHRGLRLHPRVGRPSVEIDPFAPAAIAYTSGTTGLAKGAVHSQHNILVSATMAELMAIDRRPGVIRGTASPLTILNLMILGPVATLSRGLRSVCMDRIDVLGVAEWVRKERINTLSLVPTTVRDLLTRPDIDQCDLASLTWVVVGAAMVPEGMDKLYRDRFGHDFTISYGLTENPTTVSRSHEQTPRLPGAVGHPLFHLEVGICDETGATLAPGAPGEICVRAAAKGPWANVYTPALGYWNNAEATAKLLKDGWLHTGDVGYLDERGELYVQDRRSDLINRGGANIYPAEIERVLREEPGVHDCAVAGRPDARLGQTVAAFIQPSVGVNGHDLIERLQQRCAREIAKYKIPAHWVIVEGMPRNAMGKIIKSRLSDIDGKAG
jgi:acyl-CoA synthetase (AMP-forming)/AMP-acid ligase II